MEATLFVITGHQTCILKKQQDPFLQNAQHNFLKNLPWYPVDLKLQPYSSRAFQYYQEHNCKHHGLWNLNLNENKKLIC